MGAVQKSAVVLALASLSIGAANAAEVKPHYVVGYDVGGDRLAWITYTNGDTSNVKANEGLHAGFGMSIISDDKSIETEIALSYKMAVIAASNGDFTWSRWPIDLLLFYRSDKMRFGGGLTYHMNPKLSGSGIASGLGAGFKDSAGYIVQADWRITPRMNLGLRYTGLDYELEDGGLSVSSNGVGIVFGGNF